MELFSIELLDYIELQDINMPHLFGWIYCKTICGLANSLMQVINMKSVFDSSTREELINRVNRMDPQSQARWGKMDVFQMLRRFVSIRNKSLSRVCITTQQSIE